MSQPLIKTDLQQQNAQKISKLQPLELQQLEKICGGSSGSDPEWRYLSIRRYS